jgi:hypothetical protein
MPPRDDRRPPRSPSRRHHPRFRSRHHLLPTISSNLRPSASTPKSAAARRTASPTDVLSSPYGRSARISRPCHCACLAAQRSAAPAPDDRLGVLRDRLMRDGYRAVGLRVRRAGLAERGVLDSISPEPAAYFAPCLVDGRPRISLPPRWPVSRWPPSSSGLR